MKKTLKKAKGITLVALVITIIILLILAGISISALTNTGIFQKAKDAKVKSEEVELKQNETLDSYESELDKYLPKKGDFASKVKVGDYVDYKPDAVDNTELTTLKDNLTKYSSEEDSITNSNITSEKLYWRVLDINETTGEVRLISSRPIKSTGVRLYGYNGYNNCVKLIDDVCSTLYNNKTLASKVENVKIEDIQDKMVEKDYSKLDAEYGKTYGKTYEPTKRYYPSIFAQEKGQEVNEKLGKELDLSEQKSYIEPTDKLEASSLKTKITAWLKYNYESDEMIEWTTADFNNPTYYELFINSGNNPLTYVMSSRCVDASSDVAYFCVRFVQSGIVAVRDLCASDGTASDYASPFPLRPVITLKSNVQLNVIDQPKDEDTTGGDEIYN